MQQRIKRVSLEYKQNETADQESTYRIINTLKSKFSLNSVLSELKPRPHTARNSAHERESDDHIMIYENLS